MQKLFLRRAGMAFAVALIAVYPAGAAPSMKMPKLRTLTVSGEGDVKAAPDEARLTAGVVSQAPTANAALDLNQRGMDAVFAALKQQGIPDKAIQTSGFSISPQYDTTKESPQRIVGYEVSNSVTITIDDLSKLGAAIDALVSSGANSMGGISFTIHDPKPLLRQAREAAVKDAMARADTLAHAAGVTLGPVMKIEEQGSNAPRPVFRAQAVMGMDAGTPIAAGENTITANVSMVFEIK